MKVLGIIPARFASTRFPGKPLADIHGKTMIQRVYEQASAASGLDAVVVATDDDRIIEAVKSFGGEVIRTSTHHQSGTDRCAEVIRYMAGFDVVINIQGDEPFIDPEQINLVASCFDNEETAIATLVKEISTEDELFNPNIPKVVMDPEGRAIYFSRSTIPYLRGTEQQDWLKTKTFFKHIGIYGYRPAILQRLAQLAPSALEQTEQLEQLRWLENGYTIQTKVTTHETIAVDTPEDLEKVKHRFK